MGRHRRGKGGKGKNKRKGGGGGPRPKLRFSYGDRVECRANDAWATGTIVRLWYDTEKDYDDGKWTFHEGVPGFIAPYQILLDSGDLLFAPEDTDDLIRKSDAPPMPIDHGRGTRVEVKLGQSLDWRVGTVISADKKWPYYIAFDDGEYHNFYGPEQFIRACDLRFRVGDRVELKRGEWAPGTIVRLQVENDFWEEGGTVPYEMRLDDGTVLYIPTDTDEFVRESTAPPLEVQFARGERVECKLGEKCDDWRPATVVQSNEDWAQHDRPPYFLRFDDGSYDDFWGPQSCIRASSIAPEVSDLNELSLAGISEEEMFAPPPTRPDCPICFIPLPIECDEYRNEPCCGKTICSGCDVAQMDEFGQRKACAFCRSPLSLTEEDFLSLIRKRVELGDAEATFCLGCHYSRGAYGLPEDDKKAFEHFLRAAELGSGRACTNVATEYLYGNGSIVEKDEAKGIHWFVQGAKLGEVRAMYGLGGYAEQAGKKEIAARHFTMAAAAGFAPALTFVQYLYRQGVLSKEEYAEVLRANQRSKEEEWSREREI